MRHKHWGEAETGGAQPQPHSPGAVRGRKESPCSLWGGARPCRHLNFSLLASERESISVVLGCQFVGICYSSPRTLTHTRALAWSLPLAGTLSPVHLPGSFCLTPGPPANPAQRTGPVRAAGAGVLQRPASPGGFSWLLVPLRECAQQEGWGSGLNIGL